MRECRAEQRTSSWLRARVAKGLRAAPLRQFGRATARKAAQGRRVPGSSLTIMCCAGISCVGCRKLAYSYGSFMPRELKMVPVGTRDSALRVAKKLENTQANKRIALQSGDQLFTIVALIPNVFHHPFFASGPPHRLRSRPADSRNSATLPHHSRAGPETPSAHKN